MPRAIASAAQLGIAVIASTAALARLLRDCRNHPHGGPGLGTSACGSRRLGAIALHDCRHTYASLMIAAGSDLKAVSAYLGHASINITLDRYGHLMPGSQAEAAHELDKYVGEAAAS